MATVRRLPSRCSALDRAEQRLRRVAPELRLPRLSPLYERTVSVRFAPREVELAAAVFDSVFSLDERVFVVETLGDTCVVAELRACELDPGTLLHGANDAAVLIASVERDLYLRASDGLVEVFAEDATMLLDVSAQFAHLLAH